MSQTILLFVGYFATFATGAMTSTAADWYADGYSGRHRMAFYAVVTGIIAIYFNARATGWSL
jgi:hypothetical protein